MPSQPKRQLLTQIAHAHLREAVRAWRMQYVTSSGCDTIHPAPAKIATASIAATAVGITAANMDGCDGAVPLRAVDATAGNGHDTLFLAQLLGADGEVVAFDIQPQALANTAARLRECQLHTAAEPVSEGQVNHCAESRPNLLPAADALASVADAPPPDRIGLHLPIALASARGEHRPQSGALAAVRLVEASHAQMLAHLPVSWRGTVCAITFNLGYLPGGDKARVTVAESTLPALDAALQLLAPCGLLSVLCYRGHTEGLSETTAIRHWLDALPQGFAHSVISASPDAPAHAPLLLHIRRLPA